MSIEPLSFNGYWTSCCACGVLFAITEQHWEQLVKTRANFKCPNGHDQHFVAEKKEEEKEDENKRKYRELMIRSAHEAEQNEAKISELEVRLNGGVRKEIISSPDEEPIPVEPPVAPAAATQEPAGGSLTLIHEAAPALFDRGKGKNAICTLCGKTFAFAATMRQHLEKIHNRADAEQIVFRFHEDRKAASKPPPKADAAIDGKRVVCLRCGVPYRTLKPALTHFKKHGITVDAPAAEKLAEVLLLRSIDARFKEA